MAWGGYGEYAGNEIFNSARTQAYAKAAGAYWFKGCFEDEYLPLMLGDGAQYTTPLLDNAPWVDPDIPASFDFWGAYPISVDGIEDSTRTATVNESTLDGGIPGRIRHATKSVVFNMALLGATECAVEYGMRWLRRALLSGPCGSGGNDVTTCLGDDFCYLSCAPCLEVDVEAVGTGPEILQPFQYETASAAAWPFNSILGSVDTNGTVSVSTTRTRTNPTSIKYVLPVSTRGYTSVTGVTGLVLGKRYHAEAWVWVEPGGPAVALDATFQHRGDIVTAQNQWVKITTEWTYTLTGSMFLGIAMGPVTNANSVVYMTSPTIKLLAEEVVTDPEECLDPFRRTLKKFAVVTGPNVTAKRTMSDGCATMWTVQYTGVAGNPWEYGAEIPIIEGFMDPAVLNPFVSDITGNYQTNGVVTSDAGCSPIVWTPFVDPLCPALIQPPPPPSVPLGCYNPPVNWYRRQITIPAEYIPLWDSVVPTITIHAAAQDIRNLRLRFYANPYGNGNAIIDDACAYCGDIVVSYIPASHSMIMDGPNERVYMISPGGVSRRADSLVYATDGTPFMWPVLTCGSGFVVTFDLPQNASNPSVDLTLTPRTA